MSMQGVSGEDKIELNKEESKAVKLRSRKLLLSLIYPVRGRLLFSLLIVVLSQALRVAGPALIALAIDWALPAALKSDTTPLFLVVGGYLFAAVATASLISWFLRFAAKINQDVLLDLRQRIFIHTQKLSLEFHEKYTSGRVISRQTSDLDAIKELLDTGGNEMIAGLLFMFFTATALVLLDPVSFWILMVSWIPLILITRWFQVNSRLMFRESRVSSAKLIVHFVETMTGIRAVKAFRKEKRNEATYGVLVEDYRHINARVIQLFGIYDPGLIVIGNITVAAILLSGGIRVLEGSLGIGVMTAAILYARRFYDPMEDLAMFYNSYQSATSALEKISGVLEEQPSVPEAVGVKPPENFRGQVKFEAVSFHYPSRPAQAALKDFNLQVAPGETVALVGPSGAGKSTVLQLLLRFYDASSGHVRVDGVPVRQASLSALRARVGIVPQDSTVFSTSARENIRYGRPDASDAEVEAAARAAFAHDFITALPEGYSTFLGERGVRLSGGQRQRISIARAMLKNPPLLLLDEATSALDAESERMVQAALESAMSGRTTLVIAHRLATVLRADRIVVLDQGRIVDIGRHEELVARGGLYARLAAMQFSSA